MGMTGGALQEVPDVVGMTLRQAEDLLKGAGILEVRTTVTKPPGEGRFSGECRVVRQQVVERLVSLVVAYPYYQKDTVEGRCT